MGFVTTLLYEPDGDKGWAREFFGRPSDRPTVDNTDIVYYNIIYTSYDLLRRRCDDGDGRTDGRTDLASDTIYAHELKVVVMPVIYVAFRLCDYNLYVCPALRNETCF